MDDAIVHEITKRPWQESQCFCHADEIENYPAGQEGVNASPFETGVPTATVWERAQVDFFYWHETRRLRSIPYVFCSPKWGHARRMGYGINVPHGNDMHEEQ